MNSRTYSVPERLAEMFVQSACDVASRYANPLKTDPSDDTLQGHYFIGKGWFSLGSRFVHVDTTPRSYGIVNVIVEWTDIPEEQSLLELLSVHHQQVLTTAGESWKSVERRQPTRHFSVPIQE